ncbi:hypothetical protein A2U01_0091814, partial [Trifolium medium]|nr:hypothetical protein [Trifolium medium]
VARGSECVVEECKDETWTRWYGYTMGDVQEGIPDKVFSGRCEKQESGGVYRAETGEYVGR